MAISQRKYRRVGRNTLYDRAYLLPMISFVIIIIIIFIFMMNGSNSSAAEHLELSTVTGYFQQDDPGTDATNFDFTKNNFGLIERSYENDASFDPDLKMTQWQRFEAEVFRLNSLDKPKTQYKVLYMGRHGEGYHNVAESFYGTKAWDCYWSLQNGNETMNWLDAELSSIGVSQAQSASKFWAEMIEIQRIPVPEVYYVSPLLRCQQTAWNTFFGLSLPSDRPFKPIIKELLRECIGVHTCDKRSSKTQIQARYPDWIFEDGFTETDELWSSTLRETNEAVDQRTKLVLDDILLNDKHTFVSISSHSGQIGSTLRVLGHREFKLNTGQVIPVLVKINRIPGPPPPVKKAPWFIPEICESPPVAT